MTTRTRDKSIVIVIVLAVLLLVGAAFLNFSTNSANVLYSGTNGLDFDDGDIKINWAQYPTQELQLSESLFIDRSGTYILSGDIENGSIVVDAGDENGVVKLVLNDLNVKCDDGPAIYIKSADDIVIETAKDSENSLISGKNFRVFEEDQNVDATIYSKGDLSFYGEGILYVESNYRDAIVSKDDLTIRSGEIQVKSAYNGILGKDSVYIVDGKISIEAKQDGIKSNNSENIKKGFVYIENGDIEIDTSDDGIHATSALIIDDGKINITNSYEGLEGGKVIINGGDIDIVALDDGINVAGGDDESAFLRPGAQGFANFDKYLLIINGGEIYVNAAGDGLDSNGLIYINGGEIAVDGPISSADGALDSEGGIFFNGGSVVAVGASGMAEAFAEGSLGYGVDIYFDSTLAKKTKISIKDSNGNELISHVSAKTFNNAVIGVDGLALDDTYYIYINDKKYEDFVISDYLTTVGESGSFQAPGGGDMQIKPDEMPAEPEGGFPGGPGGEKPDDMGGRRVERPEDDGMKPEEDKNKK